MRRPVSISIVTGALLLMSSVAGSTVAQDASTADHPFVGAWLIHPTPNDPNDVALLAISGDGTLSNTDAEGSTGIGAWAPTGDQSVELTFDVIYRDPESGMTGVGIVRADGEVAADGQTFAGSYTIELPAGMAEMAGLPAGELGPSDVTGDRIVVESMGEPVGPIPSFEEIAPQASAAPTS